MVDEATPTRAKRARSPAATKETTSRRQDILSEPQRRQANANQIAKSFYGVNELVSNKLQDDYYKASPEEAQQFAEAMIETGEWMGIGEIPPPLTLLAITLNFYIPRAFHYWVTGRDSFSEEEEAEFEATRGEPPPFVDVPA